MDQREKLIKLIRSAKITEEYFAKDILTEYSIKNVADHLIANGVVVLPCKVGDTVYILNRNKTRVQKMIGEAPDIRCVCADEDNLCMALCMDRNNGVCAYRFKNDLSDFGKTVFLTREEAEKALAKQKGGDE